MTLTWTDLVVKIELLVVHLNICEYNCIQNFLSILYYWPEGDQIVQNVCFNKLCRIHWLGFTVFNSFLIAMNTNG